MTHMGYFLQKPILALMHFKLNNRRDFINQIISCKEWFPPNNYNYTVLKNDFNRSLQKLTKKFSLMINKTKIYFIENSYDYNADDLNSEKIAGSEKTLINISNSFSDDKNYTVKVFNNTSQPKLINNVHWENIKQIDKSDIPDFLISMSDANLLGKLIVKITICGLIVFNPLKNS